MSHKKIKWGTTYSSKYCQELGVDKFKCLDYIESLDFDVVRVCIYWDIVSPNQGTWDFSFFDKVFESLSEADTDIIPAIGMKVPRWPEFHIPKWTKNLDKEAFETALLEYIEKAIERYNKFENVSKWQIENEPFWEFGVSDRKLSRDSFKKEIHLAKSLTNKKIVSTDSGEHGDWKNSISLVDELGVNVYPIVYDGKRKRLKKNSYENSFLVNKRQDIKKNVFIAELQAEPWGDKEVFRMNEQEWRQSIDEEKLGKNVALVLNSGFNEILFWGAEWWYADIDGSSEIGDEVRRIIDRSR